MSGYTKLFSDIVDSSIWKEDSDTCKVWITLLALSDCDGYIRGSAGWLADKAKVPLKCCEESLVKFQQSDAQSRTTDNDGKRIEQLHDGWLILNYLAFRDRLSNDASAVASRERVRKHRERYKALRNAESVTPSVSVYASVSESASERRGKDARKGEETKQPIPAELQTAAFTCAWAEWKQHRIEKRKPLTPTSTKRQLATLAEWGSARAVSAIHNSISNGWQGIFEPQGNGNGHKPQFNAARSGLGGTAASDAARRDNQKRLRDQISETQNELESLREQAAPSHEITCKQMEGQIRGWQRQLND